MSFILEALRKSESERQSLGKTSIADLPIGHRSHRQPWWVIVIAVLLIVNLFVLIAVLLRDRFAPSQPSNEHEAAQVITNASQASMANNANPNIQTNSASNAPAMSSSLNLNAATSAAPLVRPLAQEAAPAPQVEYTTVPRTELELANAGASVPAGPTLVRALESPQNSVQTPPNTGTVAPLADIRIDLHVYSKNPRESFVMINMRRYMEGQRLIEGPMVEQITPEGVVLNYNGTRYQLNRN